ncbi:MAG: response regulator transcription factor [Elusimicrobia bacterium]|nr:response regulator transcription factor [Elusimicrobiota bacterium]
MKRPAPAAKINKRRPQGADGAAWGTDGKERLTKRETQILRMIAMGAMNKEIARSLGISRRTVEVHRLNLRNKLRKARLAELVRFALEEGLIN